MSFLDSARLKDPRRFSIKEPFSHNTARPITGVVADDRTEKESEHNKNDVQLVWDRCGHQTRNHQQRIARQEKPDRQSGLGENDKEQPEINPYAEPVQ